MSMAGHYDCDSAVFNQLWEIRAAETTFAGSRGGPSRAKGYYDLEEVGRHTGRIGRCPDQAAGDRLSTPPDLQGRLVCKKRKLLFEIDPRTFQPALD
jgi:hypothetical protein